MLKWKLPCLWLVMLCALMGCQTLYNPSLPQVPLMMGGDETQAALNVSNAGYGLQLAYSPYYHWVITGNGSMFTVPQDTALVSKYRNMQGELGTGFYHCFNENLRFEIITGLGAGRAGIDKMDAHWRKVFLQPSVGVSTRMLDIGLTARFSYVQHHKDLSTGVLLRPRDNGMFFDPSLMLRAGYEQVKFNVQIGWNIPLADPQFNYRRVVAGAGVHVTLFRDFDRFGH